MIPLLAYATSMQESCSCSCRRSFTAYGARPTAAEDDGSREVHDSVPRRAQRDAGEMIDTG